MAVWRNKVLAGDAEYLIEDDNRALITMIEVSDNALVGHKWLCFGERRESFRGHDIGKRILREVIREAKAKGVREIYGKIIASNLNACPFLLDWYEGEGFEIFGPDHNDIFPHLHRVIMCLG